MVEPRESNRRLWDEWTTVHESSDFYNLESFKKGDTLDRPFDAGPGLRVRAYEVEELGSVRGKDLLHLQCHFGIDTLSWARLGARVVGADFSGNAISLARVLAAELDLGAEFVHSTIEELPAALDRTFDVVYTSRGAITWIGDLGRWAVVIAHFLRPGGTFYMSEFHPVLGTFDDEAPELRIRWPYFHSAEPLEFPVKGSYADRDAKIGSTVEYGWIHDIGYIVTSLAGAGLVIELLHEMDWVDYQSIPVLVGDDDGRWRLPPEIEGELPLMFSIRARKP